MKFEFKVFDRKFEIKIKETDVEFAKRIQTKIDKTLESHKSNFRSNDNETIIYTCFIRLIWNMEANSIIESKEFNSNLNKILQLTEMVGSEIQDTPTTRKF